MDDARDRGTLCHQWHLSQGARVSAAMGAIAGRPEELKRLILMTKRNPDPGQRLVVDEEQVDAVRVGINKGITQLLPQSGQRTDAGAIIVSAVPPVVRVVGH